LVKVLGVSWQHLDKQIKLLFGHRFYYEFAVVREEEK